MNVNKILKQINSYPMPWIDEELNDYLKDKIGAEYLAWLLGTIRNSQMNLVLSYLKKKKKKKNMVVVVVVAVVARDDV